MWKIGQNGWRLKIDATRKRNVITGARIAGRFELCSASFFRDDRSLFQQNGTWLKYVARFTILRAAYQADSSMARILCDLMLYYYV